MRPLTHTTHVAPAVWLAHATPALATHPRRAYVTHYGPEDAERDDLHPWLLHRSGMGGMVIRDHSDGRREGTCLWAAEGAPPEIWSDVLREGMARGVDYIECYGPDLPQLYSTLGWVSTRIDPWCDAYAPPGWDYAAHGRPDYHTMRRLDPGLVRGFDAMMRGWA